MLARFPLTPGQLPILVHNRRIQMAKTSSSRSGLTPGSGTKVTKPFGIKIPQGGDQVRSGPSQVTTVYRDTHARHPLTNQYTNRSGR
jgi:hypothetical protein